MAFHILPQMPHPFAGVVRGTFVMDLATGPLDRIGPWTGGRSVEQLQAGMSSEPRLHFLSRMQFRVIDPEGEVGTERRGRRPSQRLQQVKKKPGLVAIPHPLRDGARSQVEGARQLPLLVGPWRQPFPLVRLGQPLIAHLG